jgi:hypothetical protein
MGETCKNIILIPYAEKKEKCSGLNIKKTNQRKDIYLKNACVALITAKKANPYADVALVTNIEVPQEYKLLLEKQKIKIFNEEYDEFVFADKYVWSLAFYKLCALEKVVKKYDYKCYAYLDSDVYIQESFDGIWKECQNNILLYDINHGFGVKDYRDILNEFVNFTQKDCTYTHFGGEFFAANRENAREFIDTCKAIYQKMMVRDFCTSKGDEFIVSLAANELKLKIKNAGAYVFRFWTSTFYLVSTCYKYNSVAILHVPDEKNLGMLKIYSKYIRKGKIPSKKRSWRMLHLRKQRYIDKIKVLIKRILKNGYQA